VASVLLRSNEQLVVAYDPQALLMDITMEYEGLRSRIRERRDVAAAEIALHARRCARALIRLARTAQRAERQAIAPPPVPSPPVAIGRVTTPAPQPVAPSAVANCSRRRRCRRTDYLLFPGL